MEKIDKVSRKTLNKANAEEKQGELHEKIEKKPQKTEKPQESCNYPVFEWYFSSGYKRCKNKNKKREIMIQLAEIKLLT